MKCPHCNGDGWDWDDLYETVYEPEFLNDNSFDNGYIEYGVAYCPHCEKQFVIKYVHNTKGDDEVIPMDESEKRGLQFTINTWTLNRVLSLP